MALARAELLADGGDAAGSDELFRTPSYLAAEGVTHTLRIETGATELVAPLIVRGIPGTGERDAASPYGYPGIVPATEQREPTPLSPGDVDWSATGLVSIFARATALGPHAIAGAERGTLQISDPAMKRKSRPGDRRQIRRNEADGYTTSVRTGPDTGPEEREGFRRAYEQTMVRTEASERYFFGADWFDALLSSPRTWLVTVAGPEGDTAAASIAALSDGVLHYFLSGTADDHLRTAPMKNAVATQQALSAELEAPLNLGGGLRPGDGLEEFKRGFANRQEPFLAHEIVCDAATYERLSANAGGAEGFFPAYRAG